MRSADQSPGGENLHDRSANKVPEPGAIAATARVVKTSALAHPEAQSAHAWPHSAAELERRQP
jgi:hypothetical protein